MSRRKSFSKGIDAIFSDVEKSDHSTNVLDSKELKEPKKVFNDQEVKKKEIRTTVVLEEELLDKVKALAFWERKPLKVVFCEALSSLLKSRSEVHGESYIDSAIENRNQNTN